MTDAAEWDDVPPPGTGWDRWDYLQRYVGPNWERFERTAMALKAARLGLSWSWAAFLFPFLWVVYRRRVLWFLLLVAAIFLFDLVPIDVDGGTVELLLMLVLGIFGKSLYLRGGLRRIDRIIASVPDEAGRMKQVDLIGGVNSNAVLVVLLLTMVGSVFLLWYTGPEMVRVLQQMRSLTNAEPESPEPRFPLIPTAHKR